MPGSAPEGPVPDPVFKDRITAPQAPAAQQLPDRSIPQSRIDAVLQRLESRTAEITPHINKQPTPDMVRKPITKALGSVDEARDLIELLADLTTESGPGAGFKAKFTGRMTEGEKARQIDEAQDVLTAAEARANEVTEQVKPDEEAAQMYSKGYLEKQAGITRDRDGNVTNRNRNEELIAANKKGGPMTTSAEMKVALKHQDRTQKEAKAEFAAAAPLREQQAEYRRLGLADDEASMLPTAIYEAIRTKIKEQYTYKTESALEQGIRFHQSVYDIAREYAEQNGVTIDPEKYRQVVEVAQNGTWGGQYNKFGEQDALLHRYLGHNDNIGNLRNAGYANARTDLEPLFSRLQVPEGPERVAYIYAFCAAKLTSDDLISHPVHFVRDLLAETAPVTYLDAEGAVHQDKPLGLGYLIGPEARRVLNSQVEYAYPALPNERGERGGTSDFPYSDELARAAAALQKANEMTVAFNDRAVRNKLGWSTEAFQSIRVLNGRVYSSLGAFRLTQDHQYVPFYPKPVDSSTTSSGK